MRVPPETVCRVCKKCFCCAACRRRHEINQHAIAVHRPNQEQEQQKKADHQQQMEAKESEQTNMSTNNNNNTDAAIENAAEAIIYLFCPICEARPLTLRDDMHDELLQHIAQNHLPLRCHKCAKTYTHIDDLRTFSKCLEPLMACESVAASTTSATQDTSSDSGAGGMQDRTCDTDSSKVTVKQAHQGGGGNAAVAAAATTTQSSISTQTSPMLPERKDIAHLTPIAVLNVCCPSAIGKSGLLPHEQFISDSVSSIRNISSITNSSLAQRSIGVNCGSSGEVALRVPIKLVRTTSTPVLPKPKETTFNASGGGHVSSIYGSGSDCDHSMPVIAPPNHGRPAVGSPCHPPPDGCVPRHRNKVSNARGKLAAHTPLRQVMSKSIQKAMAEHGMPGGNVGGMMATSPLDLRLSPALRRTNSEGSYCVRRRSPGLCDSVGDSLTMSAVASSTRVRVLSSQKRVESIVITRLKRLRGGVSSTGSSSVDTDSTANGSSQTGSTAAESVYETCRSVEIITSTTELTTSQAVFAANKLAPPLPMPSQLMIPLTTCSNDPITPITRIPAGAMMNKKAINFQTPSRIEETDIEIEMGTTSTTNNCCATPDSACVSPAIEAYFTPNATPLANENGHLNETEQAGKSERRRNAVPRNLNSHFRGGDRAPMGRPSYQRWGDQAAHDRVESILDDCRKTKRSSHTEDDDVFLPPLPKVQQAKGQEEKGATTARGRSWSFSALVSSVLRLPHLRDTAHEHSQRKASDGATSASAALDGGTSLIKRCASIAGSLVRSKPLVDAAQLQSLKRKRTNTLDGPMRSYAQSPPSCGSSGSQSSGSAGRGNNTPTVTSPYSTRARMSTKRLRVQGRKPIERMRLGS